MAGAVADLPKFGPLTFEKDSYEKGILIRRTRSARKLLVGLYNPVARAPRAERDAMVKVDVKTSAVLRWLVTLQGAPSLGLPLGYFYGLNDPVERTIKAGLALQDQPLVGGVAEEFDRSRGFVGKLSNSKRSIS